MNHPTQRYILCDDYDDMIDTLRPEPWKVVLLGLFWWGYAPWFSKSLPCFIIKNVIFHTHFQT